MNKYLLGFTAAVMMAITAPASAGLIQNGGFETGNFTDWTQSGDTSSTSVTNDTPHTGTFSALAGPPSLGYLSQTITTEIGAEYTLSFWLKNGDDTRPLDSQFLAFAGSTKLVELDNSAKFGWTYYSSNFNATSITTTIKFGFMNQDYFGLDDVDVVKVVSAVPEPSTLAMTGVTAAAGLLAMARRRKLRRTA